MALGDQLRSLMGKVFDNNLIPGFSTARTLSLTGVTSPSYVPATGAVTGTSFTDASVKATLRSVRIREIERSEGAMIEGDVIINARASDLTNAVAVGFEFIDGSERFRIVSFQSVKIENTVISYKCHCRRA